MSVFLILLLVLIAIDSVLSWVRNFIITGQNSNFDANVEVCDGYEYSEKDFT